MGIESVSYRFKPAGVDVERLVDWLQLRGATGGGEEGLFVVAGADYWIDLAVRADGPLVAAVQFRVAVTNPVSVVAVLEDLISQLCRRFDGTVTDAAGRVLEAEDWPGVILDEFARGRLRFTQVFGDIVMPVSADQVFTRLRER
jgi:hypothetical protein